MTGCALYYLCERIARITLTHPTLVQSMMDNLAVADADRTVKE